MSDGNRVRGIIDEPRPFSLSDRRFGNLPQFPESSIPKLADSFECDERTRFNEYDLAPAPR